MPLPAPTPRNIAIAVAGGVVVLLVVAQFVLPSMAGSRVAGELEELGPRPDVKVEAFPAVKLLFGKADRVEVDMSTARTQGSAALADQLVRAGDVDELEVRVQTLRAGPLTVRDARLTKDGDGLEATATVRDADLRNAIPDFIQLEPAAQQDGRGLLLEGGVDIPILGRIAAQARVQAEAGAITAAPENIPLAEELLKFTVFQDPRVTVTSVGAVVRSGGFGLTATGTIAG